MDLTAIQCLFDELYLSVNGWDLSEIAIKKLPYFSAALNYDEATLESFAQILEKISPHTNDVFYDLGSGLGKKVLAAALLTEIGSVRGIELLPDLFTASLQMQNRLIQSGKVDTTRIRFIHGDFYTTDFSDATIVFISIEPFFLESGLRGTLGNKLRQLKKGTKVITSELRLPLAEYTLTHVCDCIFPTRKDQAYVHTKTH